MGSIPKSPSTREAQRSRPTHKDSLLPSLPTKSNGTCILSGALYGVADELKRIGFVYELFIVKLFYIVRTELGSTAKPAMKT